jgi:hypothetical protein
VAAGVLALSWGGENTNSPLLLRISNKGEQMAYYPCIFTRNCDVILGDRFDDDLDAAASLIIWRDGLLEPLKSMTAGCVLDIDDDDPFPLITAGLSVADLLIENGIL